jgi:hypothetical protein
MSLADEIKKQLNTKEGRTAILKKISDMTFLGPVGELSKGLERKGETKALEQAMALENGAIYLLILSKLAIGKIRQLEKD